MKPLIKGGFGIIRKSALLNNGSLMLHVEFIDSKDPVVVFYSREVVERADLPTSGLVNTVRFVEYQELIEGKTTYERNGETYTHTSTSNSGTFTNALELGTPNDPVAKRLLLKLQMEGIKASFGLSEFDQSLLDEIRALKLLAAKNPVAAKQLEALEAQLLENSSVAPSSAPSVASKPQPKVAVPVSDDLL